MKHIKLLIAMVLLVTAIYTADAQIAYSAAHKGMAYMQNPYRMDIDHDGIKDIWFYAEIDGGGNRHLYARGQYGAQVETMGANDANRLLDSDRIGNNTWQDSAYLITEHPILGIPTGPFAPNDSGYIGFRIMMNSQWHYGWMRVKADPTFMACSITVYDYAYQTTPNTFIKAGQTKDAVTGIEDVTEAGSGLYYADGKIYLRAAAEQAGSISLMDMQGRCVQQWQVSPGNRQVPVRGNIVTGIYSAVRYDDKGSALGRTRLLIER